MERIQFIQLTPEQFNEQIAETVSKQLTEFLEVYKPKQPEDYLTRQQVAEMFQIDISTVHNWSKRGKLKPLGISGRVYFRRSDLEQCLTPLSA